MYFPAPEPIVFVEGVGGGGAGELLDCGGLLREKRIAGLEDLCAEGCGGCVVDTREKGSYDAGLFGEVVDDGAEGVADCALFVNLLLEGAEDGGVNVGCGCHVGGVTDAYIRLVGGVLWILERSRACRRGSRLRS